MQKYIKSINKILTLIHFISSIDVIITDYSAYKIKYKLGNFFVRCFA